MKFGTTGMFRRCCKIFCLGFVCLWERKKENPNSLVSLHFVWKGFEFDGNAEQRRKRSARRTKRKSSAGGLPQCKSGGSVPLVPQPAIAAFAVHYRWLSGSLGNHGKHNDDTLWRLPHGMFACLPRSRRTLSVLFIVDPTLCLSCAGDDYSSFFVSRECDWCAV